MAKAIARIFCTLSDGERNNSKGRKNAPRGRKNAQHEERKKKGKELSPNRPNHPASRPQINFKSYRGVYVKHTTTTDPARGAPRRRVVVERMTLPPARSAATVAASAAHLSSTGGALASTLTRPATLAASGLSALGHATVSTLSSLAYTLHHGEQRNRGYMDNGLLFPMPSPLAGKDPEECLVSRCLCFLLGWKCGSSRAAPSRLRGAEARTPPRCCASHRKRRPGEDEKKSRFSAFGLLPQLTLRTNDSDLIQTFRT